MLTPLDIENKKFAKQMMNGYSVEEVDDFLDEIGVDYAKKCRDLNDKDNQIEDLKKEMSKYKNIESTLQNTLIMAQSTAEEVKSVAKQQAEQIVAEAKISAQKDLDLVEQQISLKVKETEELQKKFDIYKAKMEALLISQLELIKEINKESEF